MMVLVFLLAMLFMISDANVWCYRVGYCSIALNLGLLFGGIFGDPGVKPETYLLYTKSWFSGGKDEGNSSDDSES